MPRTSWWVLAVFLLPGTVAARNRLPPEYDPGVVLSGIEMMHAIADHKAPRHLFVDGAVRDGTEFDVMRYFDVLEHISPPDGQVLDYVYCYHGGDGAPRLYMRAIEAMPLRTCEELEQADGTAIPRIELDGTPESYFEAAVYRGHAGQFYLAWHANYADTTFVTSQVDVEGVLYMLEKIDFGTPISDEAMRKARGIDTTPRVWFLDCNTAVVSVVVFSKWSGFSRVTASLSRKSPYRVKWTSRRRLVRYNCGMMF